MLKRIKIALLSIIGILILSTCIYGYTIIKNKPEELSNGTIEYDVENYFQREANKIF